MLASGYLFVEYVFWIFHQLINRELHSICKKSGLSKVLYCKHLCGIDRPSKHDIRLEYLYFYQSWGYIY
jgi:hypothetical protein